MDELKFEFQVFLESQNLDDFSLILLEMLDKNMMDFVSFMHQVSTGHGLVTSEETGFGLENDYDFSNEFCSIDFFVRGFESSSIDVSKFIYILDNLCNIYLSYHPIDYNILSGYLYKIRLRYQKFI